VSVALPELPDDRRAQPPRHGRNDEPSGPPQNGAPGVPVPHLPSTPWPIDGLNGAPRLDGLNGQPANGHTAGGYSSNGYPANGYSAPQNGGADGYGNGYANGGGSYEGGPSGSWEAPLDGGHVGPSSWGGAHRPAGEPGGFGPPANGVGRGAPDQNGRFGPGAPNGMPAPSGFPGGVPINVNPGPWTAEPESPGEMTEGRPAAYDPNGPRPGENGRFGGQPVGPMPGQPVGFRPDDGGQFDGRPMGPRPEDSGRFPLPGQGAESTSGSHPQRRVRSDVPPPRRTARPGIAPGGQQNPEAFQPGGRQAAASSEGPPTNVGGPSGAWNGVAGTIDQPTAVGQPLADDAYDEDVPGFPGKHRRRAGESPDERPASSYREQAAAAGHKGRGGRRRRPAFWKELPILIVVALLLTFLIQTFVAKVYVIPSGSMETTLHGCTGCNNDRVLVDKVTYRFSDPQPGNVVVFRGPDGWTSEFTADQPANVVVRALQGLGSLIGLAPPDEKDFIKRVIAVGGQTVQCCDSRNRVLVDGKPLNEPYIYFLPDAGAARQDTFGPVTVPAGELWMMGDSRNNSADSRVPGHGPVPIANVIGRARMIVLPFARFGSITSPNPQATVAAVGMGAGDTGAPVGLGMVALLPLIVLRRRERDLGGFLPRSALNSPGLRRGVRDRSERGS
jgi:signal peptidase I